MAMAGQEKLTLEVSLRSLMKKKVGRLRRQGIVPAVVHGKDFEPIFVQVDEHDFEMLYRKAHTTSIVSLNMGSRAEDVLIHHVTRDKLTGRPVHIEFLKVDPTRVVTVEVPLVFTGTSAAEKEGRGKITHEETSILVRCTPDRIPSAIEVDVSSIKGKHDVIHAGDLALPEGVHLGPHVSEKKVIAYLSTARGAEVEAAAEAAEGVEASPEEAPA